MPIITIDQREVQVEPGSTVMQAAEELGVHIPRYCYHPGLSTAGSCRMCLVEIEKMPKLAISCHTQVQEGMQVHTLSEQVARARRTMLEFLLIDHPLDCPVCDQAGECDLQNYYMEIGQHESRFLEDKPKSKKASVIGPHVILDQERCILCTRCTRFCKEISKTDELGVFNRGNQSVIDLFPGRLLDNPYSGNVIDICPVGALTEREFRFQCRVWYLRQQNSICTGCSRGCNISLHHNASRPHKAGGKRVQRLKPRFNPEVNQWWICDEGRFGYEFIDQNRIEHPHRRVNGELETAGWDPVLEEITTSLETALKTFGSQSIGVITSPQLSNETLHLIRKLFGELMGIEQIGHHNPWEREGFHDDFLIRADKNPNRRGAQAMGFDYDSQSLLEKAASGEIKVLYIFQHDFKEDEAAALLEQADYVIFQGSNWTRTADFSNVVLPSATHSEEEGTFTNFEGRIQHFEQAFLPLSDSKSGVEIMALLAERLHHEWPYTDPEKAFMDWLGKPYNELNDFGELIEIAPDNIE
ncbi:MAG: molybdopterin-dependent oxidoreductase [Acidobacteriota bacterium]